MSDLIPNTEIGGFSVKNIKNLETSNGIAWTCTIYQDGKKVGTAENDGRGGQTRIYGTQTQDQPGRYAWNGADLEAALVKAALDSGIPAKETTYLGDHGIELELNAEGVVLKLMEAKDDLADLRRSARKQIVVDNKEGALGAFSVPPTPENIKAVEARGYTVLNAAILEAE